MGAMLFVDPESNEGMWLRSALAQEIASRGITVNCVAPGFIDTDMTRALSEEQQTALKSTVPAGRLGAPEDIAHAVAFLASPQAGYVTGSSYLVDGGMVQMGPTGSAHLTSDDWRRP